ncbi:MAG: hypothetical protein H6811_05480 [Phycisphaeraceae bacterium]|nr:hypothetical protein [Phycisphaeraceae bacterium]
MASTHRLVPLLVLIAIMGCRESQDAQPAQDLDFDPDVASLARTFAYPMRVAGAPEEINTILDRAESSLAGFRKMAEQRSDLAPVCRQAASVLQDAYALLININDRAGFDVALGLLSLGQLSEEPAPASRWAARGVRNRSSEIAAALDRIRVQRDLVSIAILEIAKQRERASGPCPLRATFRETQFPSILNSDTLTLVNESGRRLTDCYLAVRLRNAKGEVAHSVHYVADWRPSEARVAEYSSGVTISGIRMGRATVSEVETVEIGIWAQQLSYPRLILRNR